VTMAPMEVPLTPAQIQALARLYRKEEVRVKELLELEALGYVRRLTTTPRTVGDWELTPLGTARAEEISR
jgi:hypothetical protein